MSNLYYWLCGRFIEVSTWVGVALVTTGAWGLSSQDPHIQHFLVFYNQYGPQVGAFLVAMSEKRHRENWQAQVK